jgi:DnaJ-class molecular chaperone
VAAPEEDNDEGAGEATGAPEPCSPCRGTGKVISQLGGKREELECPWCEGGGVRIPEHDAQAHFKGATEPASPEDAPS